MNTITYNPQNYTGNLGTVAITAEKFEDNVLGWGTHSYEKLDDRFECIRVKIDGVTFTAYRLDGGRWEAQSQGIYRDHENGIVACLQVARNTM